MFLSKRYIDKYQATMLAVLTVLLTLVAIYILYKLFIMKCCPSKQIIVETSNGTVRGSKMKSKQGKKIYAFRGIPYGKSPTGNLRFRRSEPIESWEGVRNCTKEAKKAYQPNVMSPGSKIRFGGEDCLYLNVYTKVGKNV